jgi:hypothetical protein
MSSGGKSNGGVEFAIVLIGVILAAFLAIVGPSDRVRYRSKAGACINNLRQIDGAKQTWALETKAPSNAVPTWENIKPYLARGTAGVMPKCPQRGVYTLGSLTNAPTCSKKGHVLD